MAHTTIAAGGEIVYRTVLMEMARAAAFARMVDANAARFCGVEIVRGKSKAEKYFVQFLPTSQERQAAIRQAEWDKNQQRADAEGGDYIFWPDPDNARREWVFNPVSGETYYFWNGVCQCPQQTFRCAKAGLQCKHTIERKRRMAAGINRFGTDKQSR